MKNWIHLIENASLLSKVTNDDIIEYYEREMENDRSDLDTLLDNDWILTSDYSKDITRVSNQIGALLSSGKVRLYRAIKGNPDLGAIGIHWSTDRDTDFGNTLITIEVSIDAVDIVGTIARGIHWWDDEQEITLKRGQRVSIVSIEDREGIDPTIKNLEGLT